MMGQQSNLTRLSILPRRTVVALDIKGDAIKLDLHLAGQEHRSR